MGSVGPFGSVDEVSKYFWDDLRARLRCWIVMDLVIWTLTEKKEKGKGYSRLR